LGYGDEILATAHAKWALQKSDPHYASATTRQKVGILDARGQRRWHELWEGVEYIARPDESSDLDIVNGPSDRLYYTGMRGNRIIWRRGAPRPGEIRLTDEERAWAENETKDYGERFIVTESRYKKQGGGGANKRWPYWSEFFANRPDVVVYPMRDSPSFRHACAILERSGGYVGHEGGLHHAAAALGKRAVVIFGGYISPEVTGYDGHINLYVPDPEYRLGCGTVTPCQHCKESMSEITVEQVITAVKDMIK